MEPPPIPKRAPASARPTPPAPTRTEYPTRPKSREKATVQKATVQKATVQKATVRAAATPNVPSVVRTDRMGPDAAPDASGVLNDLRDSTAGFIGAALADNRSGKSVASLVTTPGFDIDSAAAANTAVVRAKLHAVKSLGVTGQIEDILITVTGQYHLVRPVAKWPSMFWYLVLDRADANLALARFALEEADANLKPRQKASK